MNIAETALSELFPEISEKRRIIVKYSLAFNSFNANVKYNYEKIEFRLSHKWKDVDEDIVKGLLQSLFVKMYGKKAKTINIELYSSFLKKLSNYTRQEKSDPVLEESFNRVNEKYFQGFMARPNLAWGSASTRKLGSYEYTTDTIVISTIFRNEQELLDYVMYHELLHKKLKFYDKNGRSFHHTREFRELEKKFENPGIEKALENYLKKHRLKKIFRFW